MNRIWKFMDRNDNNPIKLVIILIGGILIFIGWCLVADGAQPVHVCPPGGT